MTDRPIIFSAPMVRAILDGRKTQTRRIVLPEPQESRPREGSTLVHEGVNGSDFHRKVIGHFRPRWTVGDRLWVRERGWIAKSNLAFEPFAGNEALLAPLSPDGTPYKACPSIHMPRWASRLTLVATDVRVERLQDISEEDILAEGVDPFASEIVSFFERYEQTENGGGRCVESREVRTRKPAFVRLWNSIHGPEAWTANPWVAAVSFTVHRANIDALDIGAAA